MNQQPSLKKCGLLFQLWAIVLTIGVALIIGKSKDISFLNVFTKGHGFAVLHSNQQVMVNNCDVSYYVCKFIWMVNTWLTRVVSYGQDTTTKWFLSTHHPFYNVHQCQFVLANYDKFQPILHYPPFAKPKTMHHVGHKPHLDVNFNLMVTNHYTKNVIL